jgi:uncharacterized protein YrrD
MEHSVKELRHFIVGATDGDIGEVNDVYFDDEHWAIRYMVVETGRWLNGRKVLVSPISVRDVIWDDRIVNVNLSRQQVRDSPSIDTDKPVSRQHEVEYYNYYGYPNYWEGSNPWGLGFYPVPWVGASADGMLSTRCMDQARVREPRPRVDRKPGDSHLRSTREVIGYEIMATDGTIGSVEDFLFDAAHWVVRYVVVDTRKWLRGKHVLLPPGYVASISWSEHEVYLTVAQQAVETSPEYEPSDPLPREPETEVEDVNPR